MEAFGGNIPSKYNSGMLSSVLYIPIESKFDEILLPRNNKFPGVIKSNGRDITKEYKGN